MAQNLKYNMKITFTEFLNEFNQADKVFIESLSDYFTLSIEYELVADFSIEEEPSPAEDEKDFEKAKQYAKDQTLLDMSRGKWGYKFDNKYKLTKKTLQENEERMEKENTKVTKQELVKLHRKYVTWTYVNNLIDHILDMIDILDDDEDYIKKINKYQRDFKDEMSNYIINTLDKNIIKFVYEQNMGNLKDMMKEYLPKFTKKWGKTFKYELEADADKQRILEFSSKTYLKGLNKCFEQLNDFYDDFEKQDFWKMNNRTALHVNIGVKNKKIKWNPIKGLVLMNDMNRDKKTPFVFSDIQWRLTSRFTQSLLDGIKRNLTGEIEEDYIRTPEFTDLEKKAAKRGVTLPAYLNFLLDKGKISDEEYNNLMSELTLKYNLGFRHKDRLGTHKEFIEKNIEKLDLHDIKEAENFLNAFLIKANSDFYIKEFGIKLVELENSPGYVEFRYVGGNIGRKIFTDKILYFCYIVYLMTNDDYKKEQHHKRLYKYIEDLKQIITKDDN